MQKYQSEILEVIHQEAEWMHRQGLISDDEMSEYDKDCLTQQPKTAYKADNPARTQPQNHAPA